MAKANFTFMRWLRENVKQIIWATVILFVSSVFIIGLGSSRAAKNQKERTKNIADAEVAQEKAELKKQQDELTSLRKQAEAFDARLAVEVNEATENTEKELRMQFEHEKALSSQKYESQNVLSQQKIDSLSETIKNQQQEIVRLNKALSDANVQVTSIAEKAVGQKYSAPTGGSANNVEV